VTHLTPPAQPPCKQRAHRVTRALRISLLVIVLGMGLIGTFVTWLNWPAEEPVRAARVVGPELRDVDQVAIPSVTFTDVTREAGISFVHENGAYGDRLLPETVGSGCALFDFDGDQDVDILLINARRWPDDPRPQTGGPATMALYRNDGDWSFVDVTRQAGLAVPCFGMGAAAGDYDNDGDIDLFVSAVGPNHLFRNDAGRFTDVSKSARITGAADQWSTGCAWFDYDRDGRLDLFVCNYVHWSKQLDLAQHFTIDGTARAYGPPIAFGGTFPSLYHNEGNGRFADVSKETHIEIKNSATGAPMAKSLGVIPVDLDADGWIDIVVANDTVRNFVFHNQQGRQFDEIGVASGLAYDTQGQARGAMGIDAAQFRDDGTMGVVVGNFANEMTAIYASLGDPLQYFDAAVASGLGPLTRLELTFGIFFWDYDLDGRLDLLATNGHIEPEIRTVQQSQHYAQRPTLFWNAGAEHSAEFLRVPAASCGADSFRPLVGRGSAYADLDADGDLDVLISANGQAPRLLRNDQALGHHWLRLHLVGTTCNRDAIGARVELHAGDRVLRRRVMPTRGYLSQSEPTITFGLGAARAVERVTIRWPDGRVQEIDALPVDQTHVVRQPTIPPRF